VRKCRLHVNSAGTRVERVVSANAAQLTRPGDDEGHQPFSRDVHVLTLEQHVISNVRCAGYEISFHGRVDTHPPRGNAAGKVSRENRDLRETASEEASKQMAAQDVRTTESRVRTWCATTVRRESECAHRCITVKSKHPLGGGGRGGGEPRRKTEVHTHIATSNRDHKRRSKRHIVLAEVAASLTTARQCGG
jgi:hypothetical protein